MEDFIKDPKESAGAESATIRQGKKQWTLLFVGEYGKVIAFKRFRGLFLGSLFVLLSAISVSVVFIYLYLQGARENRGLDSSVSSLKQQVKKLSDEKDILAARLVVAESVRLKQQGKDRKKTTERSTPASPHLADNDGSPPAVAAALKRHTASAPSDTNENDADSPSRAAEESVPGSPSAEIEAPADVAVEDLGVSYDAGSNTFLVRFILRNTRSDSEPIAGQTAVALKNDEMQPHEWLTLPTVELESGMPAGENRGQNFSIVNFKTVRLRTVIDTDPGQYDTAIVFVFNSEKKLLFEKAFQINIQPM